MHMAPLTPRVAPGDDAAPARAEAEAQAVQRRSEPRSNIFLVATLAAQGASGTVRVRDLSSSGALIEGDALPSVGAALRLTRGSLTVSGYVAWVKDNRAGVRFDSTVTVADWLPNGNRPTAQQQVDEIVQVYKARPAAEERRAEPLPARASGVLHPAKVARELIELQEALNAVAEKLVEDVATAERHAGALQTLDITAQKLGLLARQLS
jgi:PilZ domain